VTELNNPLSFWVSIKSGTIALSVAAGVFCIGLLTIIASGAENKSLAVVAFRAFAYSGGAFLSFIFTHLLCVIYSRSTTRRNPAFAIGCVLSLVVGLLLFVLAGASFALDGPEAIAAIGLE